MKEGFDGKAAFYLYWDRLYSHMDFNTPVWQRIEFELIEKG